MFKTSFTIFKGIPNVLAKRALGPICVQRGASSNVAVSNISLEEHRKKIEATLKEELPKPYDGPERDLVNFPRRKRPDYPAAVRLGFIPDDWFTYFYKKTGVTGPYVFGTGLLTFVLSKEWWVIEHEFSTGVAIFILFYTAVKKFGPTLQKLVYKMVDDEEGKMTKMKTESMKALEKAIDDEQKMVWRAEGQKILMAAKRENVQMQLETEYRRRWMQVYEQVKRRLDYQMELHNTRRKMEQTHLVDWVVNSVVKSITPQQEKEALQKCLEDLKLLSAKAQ